VTGAISRARRVRVLPLALLALLSSSGFASVRSWHHPHLKPAAVEVDVIGDSLSTGLATGGDAWTDHAQRLLSGSRPTVQFVNAAENGAGYVAKGQYGDTFLDEIDHTVSPRAQIVLVFGSDNDLGQRGLAASISLAFERVRALAPRARLIVVGPPAPPAQRVQQLAAIRDALGGATRRAGGRFVDPLTLKWFQDGTRADVAADGEHPNEAGEGYLARQMSAILGSTIDAMAYWPRRP